MQVQFIPTSKQVGNYPPSLTVPLFQALRSGQKHKAIGFLMPGPQSQSRADVQCPAPSRTACDGGGERPEKITKLDYA